jgi:hypothetical protein
VPNVPERQVRALFNEQTITLYQAYSPQIADSALLAQRFVPPFKMERMTWVKPSFLWMMYRSGWAAKPGQERILAIDITRSGFEWALAHSCVSSHELEVDGSHQQWVEHKQASPVRIQWDPERSLVLEPLGHRTIQIGLSGEAIRRYVDEWIVRITDITGLADDVHSLVITGQLGAARAKVPVELAYPLRQTLCQVIGASWDVHDV